MSFVESSQGDVFIQEHNNVMVTYGSDFDKNRFQVDLETLQDYCANLDSNACICSVTDTLRNF